MHQATRHTRAPILQDWKLAKKTARYLSGTKDLKLNFMSGMGPALPVSVCCYSDADFAGDDDDRTSVSAAFVLVYGMLVKRLCKKLATVAASTSEAVIVAAALCGQSAL